jgi:hypothetical protein
MRKERRDVELEGRRVAYELNVSPRARWVRAQVGLRDGVRVFVPAGKSAADAEDFLRRRRRWLLRALDRMGRLAARIPERTLADGSSVPFLGKDLLLRVGVAPEPRVSRIADVVEVGVPRRVRGSVRKALEGWYRGEALPIFEAWVRELAERHGLTAGRVRVSDARRRWGSCSSRSGTLSFNWRLLMGPESVARYLVAHEMAHLSEPNHSPRFWAKVGDYCAAYADAERWLRRHGVGLAL